MKRKWKRQQHQENIKEKRFKKKKTKQYEKKKIRKEKKLWIKMIKNKKR